MKEDGEERRAGERRGRTGRGEEKRGGQRRGEEGKDRAKSPNEGGSLAQEMQNP